MHSIDTKTILSKENELINAMLQADIQKLDQCLCDNLLFTIPNGQTITKAMDLEAYKAGQMQIKTISASEQMVQIIEDTAVVCSTIAMEGHYFEHTIDGRYRFMRVWKLVDNTWKVIAGSSTVLQS